MLETNTTELKKWPAYLITFVLILSLYLCAFFASFSFQSIAKNIDDLRDDLKEIKSENKELRNLIIDLARKKN